MRLFALTFLAIFIFLLPSNGTAQSGITFGGKMNLPYGLFAESSYKGGGGVFGEFIWGNFPKSLPFKIMPGLHADYMWNAGESHDLNLAWFESSRISIRNHSASVHGSLRMITDEAAVRLYGEAYIGSRLFFTNTTFRYVDGDNEEDQDTDFVRHTFTQYFGWAAGLMVRLDQGIYLDLSAGRNWGSELRFVDVGSSYLVNDQLLYDLETTSSTGMLNFQAGLHFTIGSPPTYSAPKKRPSQRDDTPKPRPNRSPKPKS